MDSWETNVWTLVLTINMAKIAKKLVNVRMAQNVIQRQVTVNVN